MKGVRIKRGNDPDVKWTVSTPRPVETAGPDGFSLRQLNRRERRKASAQARRVK